MDGFDRTWYSVSKDAAFVAIAKASADQINAWAKHRGWSQIALISGYDSPFQADYKCQGESDDMQWPVMHVFRRQDGKIFHFWATERQVNHVDTVWPYWNLMDFTPEGRPDIPTPPQNFRSRILGRALSERVGAASSEKRAEVWVKSGTSTRRAISGQQGTAQGQSLSGSPCA